jgi:hypothetical protein
MSFGRLVVIGRYISFFFVLAWIIATASLHNRSHDDRRRIDTYVDIGSIDSSHPHALGIWIQGSDTLERHRDYYLFMHVTFLDSWTTLHAGMVTFHSDFGHGRKTVVSIFPCTQPPFIWILRRILLSPLYAFGLFQDTLHFDVLLSNTVRYTKTMSPFVDIVVEPVRNNHIHYLVHVQIHVQRHLPDITSVSAWYQASMTWSWYTISIWYIWYIWYICLSFITVATLVLYTVCSASQFMNQLLRS